MSSASASPAPSAPGRCAEITPGARFAIGTPPKPRAKDAEPDEVEISEPFAVEIGSATAFEQGFAVSALESQAGSTSALIAIVSADGARGKVLPLGRVHGDVDPPHLARRGGELFVAVSSADAQGSKLRLGIVQYAAAEPKIVWGGEVSELRDESTAFDIAVGAEHGVLVFDEIERKSRHQLIRLATFDVKNPATITVPRSISGSDLDAEMPALAPRPGGYWLAWVASVPKPKPGPAERKAAREAAKALARESDAGDAPPANEEPGADRVLDMGNRFIELVALDGNGSPTSEPKAVTPRDRHVLVFDLVATANGGALLAWRDDDAAPGVENRTVHIAEVRADGSVQRTLVDDDDVGAGAPSLVSESEPALPSWLALESVSDETRLAALGPSSALLDDLNREASVGNADVLAVSRGRLLLARPRGVAAELSVVACKAGRKLH